MSGASAIEWTDATWNPVRGCAVVSPGCTNCYAMKQAHRFSGKGRPYAGLTKMTRGGPVWTGEVRAVPELLDQPLRWKKPRRVFVNSMSDLFHQDVPVEFIQRVWAIMGGAPRHTFQILTKRPKKMMRLCSNTLPTYPNVWLGVSVEDQQRADERIPLLLQTPAAVRWISAEPLLGPLDLLGDLTKHYRDADGPKRGLDWVVVGGESGPGARPFDIAWARDIVRQCKAASVPCFIKQLGAVTLTNGVQRPGEWWPRTSSFVDTGRGDFRAILRDRKGGDPAEWPADLRVREFCAARAAEGREGK